MSSVKPIPEGFHTLTPHIVVKDGNEAIEFYKKAFGAEQIGCSMFSPDGKVMHAEIKIGNSMLMLCAENPQWGALSPLALGNTSVTLSLYVENADESFERAINAGANVKMPLADMFWGDRYGQVTDPSGHHWAICTHIKDMTGEEIQKAAQEAMAQYKDKEGECAAKA
ncbi:MAG: VOC family protein [Acidobacteria bacterium]|nr:VOC family protein [Acidobacteriota bacterium]